jgi:ribose transport system substrate-binding protein
MKESLVARQLGTPRSKLVVASATVGLAAALAGCGSASSGSGATAASTPSAALSKCATTAQAAVKAAEQAPQMPAIAKVDASKYSGTSVWIVLSDTTPYTSAIASGFKSAATAAGLKPTVFNGQGQVAIWNQGFEEAVSQGAKAVVLQSVVPTVLGGRVKAAADKHIIVTDAIDHGVVSASRYPGVYANADFAQNYEGKVQMDWMLSQSDCNAHVIMQTIPAYPSVAAMTGGASAEQKALCPSCQITAPSIDAAKVATDFPVSVGSALSKDPKANYMMVPYDAAVPYVLPVLQQRNSDIKIVSSTGLPANLSNIAKGGPQEADYASAPGQFVGWQLFNQALDGMAGLPAKNVRIVDRFVDKSNVGTGSVNDLFASLNNYQTTFKTAWGK